MDGANHGLTSIEIDIGRLARCCVECGSNEGARRRCADVRKADTDDRIRSRASCADVRTYLLLAVRQDVRIRAYARVALVGRPNSYEFGYSARSESGRAGELTGNTTLQESGGVARGPVALRLNEIAVCHVAGLTFVVPPQLRITVVERSRER